jgi:N12 class adenine-specific DNA methylase
VPLPLGLGLKVEGLIGLKVEGYSPNFQLSTYQLSTLFRDVPNRSSYLQYEQVGQLKHLAETFPLWGLSRDAEREL